MAVIGKIRKHSALLVVIIGVALAAFILGDFLKPGSGGNKKLLNIGVIDGQDIPGRDFSLKVEENLQMRRQNQQQNLTAQETFSVRQSIWDEMVSGIILGEQYEKLGIIVSVDELDDQIRGNEPHAYIVQNFTDPQTGAFDPQSVTSFLQNFNQVDPSVQERYLMLERMIKDDRQHTKYNNTISKGYYIPDAFAEEDYMIKNRKAKYHFVAPKYTTIADSSIVLTDSDYQKYYEEHKNNYTQEASVDIDYIVFEFKPSVEDRKNIDEEFNMLYEEMQQTDNVINFVNANSNQRYDSTWIKQGTLAVVIDSVVFDSPVGTVYGPYIENEVYHIIKLMDVQMRPDSMMASHILIAFEGSRGSEQSTTRSKEAAEALADSLRQVVQADPASFTNLAFQFSNDPSVQQNNGDLGWFIDGTMFFPFNQAVYDGNEGDIAIAETEFGFHVIKVGEKTEFLKKARVAMVNRAIEASDQTIQEIYMEASAFATKNNSLEKFENAVINEGLTKRTADKVEIMANNIPGVEYPRQIVHWAFKDDTEVGDISTVFEMGNADVVAVLKDKHEEGIATLEDIKETIEPLVIREKKAEILVNRLNEALSSGDNLAMLAVKFNTTVDTVDNTTFASYNIPKYGPEKDVIGTIFGMQAGEMSAPIQGSQGVFVVVVDKFIEPETKTEFAQQKSFLKNSMNSRISREVYNALKERTDIVDNRLYYY